jgi:NADH:ubiquinone oxidoreductase subunit 2 (subunit N)
LKMANAMFMGQPEERGVQPVSWTMRTALAVTAFATLFIGIMPDRFIHLVNWSLGIAQNSAVAKLIR